MRKYTIMLLVFVRIIRSDAMQASIDYPIVGMPCPDFTLNEVSHYKKTKISLGDFKGRWLVLDFWDKGCSTCIAGFPKVNQLQKEFINDVLFLLIARNDKKYNRNIREMYEKYRVHQNLELAIAYDTLLFDRFGVQTVPHIIVVDRNGVVRAVTGSSDLTKDNIRRLINNENPDILKKVNAFEQKSDRYDVDDRKPLLIDGNGGESNDFLYRSVLGKWNRRVQTVKRKRIDHHVDKGCFQVTGVSLSWLYKFAFVGLYDWSNTDSLHGKFSRFPILELKDSSLFHYDFSLGTGLYNYSLIVPREKANKKYLMEVMQRDLQNYFGYEVSIEKRIVTCWKLVALNDRFKNKLRTKGGPQRYEGDYAGFAMTNYSVDDILGYIQSYHPLEPSFIDETGITGNIDITMNAILMDLNDVKKAFESNGLVLVRGKKEMNVLVIKEIKN